MSCLERKMAWFKYEKCVPTEASYPILVKGYITIKNYKGPYDDDCRCDNDYPHTLRIRYASLIDTPDVINTAPITVMMADIVQHYNALPSEQFKEVEDFLNKEKISLNDRHIDRWASLEDIVYF